MEKSGIQRACDALGGHEALADRLGVTRQAVGQWVKTGHAPVDRVWRIAELTGVARKDICDPHLVDLVQG